MPLRFPVAQGLVFFRLGAWHLSLAQKMHCPIATCIRLSILLCSPPGSGRTATRFASFLERWHRYVRHMGQMQCVRHLQPSFAILYRRPFVHARPRVSFAADTPGHGSAAGLDWQASLHIVCCAQNGSLILQSDAYGARVCI